MKFVSLSQLLGCPLFGSNPWFSQLQVYCLTCGDLKKKKTEGRRDKKGEKEGVEQERRKERRKVLKERKNKK